MNCKVGPRTHCTVSTCMDNGYTQNIWDVFPMHLTPCLKCMDNNHSFDITHWGRATHICVGKLTVIGSENGLSPSRRQAIIWTNAGLLSIGPLLTYFNEVSIKTKQFSLKKMHLNMSSAKRGLCCLGPNVLTEIQLQAVFTANNGNTGSSSSERSVWRSISWQLNNHNQW